MVLFLWAIALALVIQLMFVLWNLAQLPGLGGDRSGSGHRWLNGDDSGNAEKQPGSTPRLSILIPARDEAGNIGPCLRSVLAESSPNIEVLVCDDHSTDGTTEAAQAAAADDPRLQILHSVTAPAGWTGKSHACHQLAQKARGEWWLFLDADARLGPGALEAAMDTALAQKRGLITGFPRQETGTWLERLMVPLMTFTIACHLPIRLVRHSANPIFVAAHGAFMLIHADSYRATGGHEAFKSHLVDDMQLARAVKQAGLPVTLANIHPYVSMRMYQDASGVWNGYKKNIFAGMGRNSLLLAAVLALYSFMYILPPMMLLLVLLMVGFASASVPGLLLPSLAGTLIGAAIKLAVDRSSGQPLRMAMLLPAGIMALIAIATASWHASFSGKGYWWKGRRYS
ncbi:glycosyltransferase [Paenibacillus radicis (ex Gao et al. 2016)]|uniref:Glycosyl transferase n=1 Tax=Paenibacillus radicis (ex Gao et al. 2016) TaxID=1737354 RepID=A0A917H6C0_9BACL|nr:glycosyltransferase family 2 protein [Paenibacillus radicis (ex Gao et al. 2016)]GGG68903.1 glycosyl transferase [Paenibacillus radicis (ex Gao et al. 2016)]